MFTGRISRTDFILGFVYLILPMVAVIAAYAILNMLSGGGLSAGSLLTQVINVLIYFFGAVWTLLAIPISFGLMIRRWHDMNSSGWLSLLALIPTVNFIVFLVQLFVPGTAGPNNYGVRRANLNFVALLFGKPSQATESKPVKDAPTSQK